MDQSIFLIFPLFLIYLQAVSYTHLDVYKRQDNHCDYNDKMGKKVRTDYQGYIDYASDIAMVDSGGWDSGADVNDKI